MKRTKKSRLDRQEVLNGSAARERMREIVAEDECYAKARPTPKLQPMTNNQKVALGYLNSDSKKVVFLTGSAGTGKSMLAAFKGASLLSSKKITKIYLVRPAVVVGKSVGLLPGDIKEKLEPYFKQTLVHLEKFLGSGFMNFCLKDEKIEMAPVEYLRGMSFEDCLVICEECQNFTREEMEMMVTRIGKNASIIFTGDTKQHDLKGESGLKQTIELINRIACTAPAYMSQEDMDELDDGIGIVQFMPEDVVRGGLTKAFVKVFYYNN